MSWPRWLLLAMAVAATVAAGCAGDGSSATAGSGDELASSTTARPGPEPSTAGPSSVGARPLFIDTFDDGVDTGWNRFLIPIDAAAAPGPLGIEGEQLGAHYLEHSDAIALEADPEDPGNEVLRVSVGPGDEVTEGDRRAGKDRSELEREGFGEEGVPGTHQWYRWRMRLVSPFEGHSDPGGFTILAQWHQDNRALTTEQLADGYAKPPVAVTFTARPEPTLHISYGLGHAKRTLSAPVRLDTWVELTVEVQWAIDDTGSVRAWVDGLAMAASDGSTVLPGANAPNGLPLSFKVGIYRGHDRSETHQVLYDDVAIFDQDPR